MSRRSLRAAGITGDRLRASYLACRELNRAHGRTYFLATLLLPPRKRPYVHALYGFARYADEFVDSCDPALTPSLRARALGEWSAGFLTDLDNRHEPGATGRDPITAAVIDTIRRWDIPTRYFQDFLDSMRMDLTITSYDTYADLERYMWGSAAVIGLQMLPILEPVGSSADVAPYAVSLGYAFQLTNFLRDIGEDLRRGRVYLPQESLREFGVEVEMLSRGVVDRRVRDLLRHEIARTRAHYADAWPGTRLVAPSSRPCLEAAWRLYGSILDEIEAADYQVLDRRAVVGIRRKVAVVSRALIANR